ncbi:hypothetical protein PQQ51_29005 [Paraburkholderia xenovorans]|uniref:hypothetical protein n=1 Tax=Paraburkholderia xenovorans TaxID=36873 RepID=UPI0038B9F0E9
MIQMMMSTLGGSAAARASQQQHALMLRKIVGLAIVTSGFAVIVAQVLQHAFSG